MASQLKLQVLLAAVDKITRPLKSIQKAAGLAAKDVSDTQRHIKELNKQAGQIDGYRKLSDNVGVTTRELAKAQSEVNRLTKEINLNQNPTKTMTREFDRAQAQVKKLKQQQEQLIKTQQNHRSTLRESGVDTRNLGTHQRDLARQLGTANRALEQQKNKLAQLAQQQKRLAKARQTYDNTKQLQGQIAGQGAGMVAGGAAIAAPVLATVIGYAAFEDAMKGVAKQVEGARDENGNLTTTYYEMAAAIKQISEEIPQLNGAIDIASLVEGGARMGVKGKEDLLAYARTAAMAAKAFELPADQLGEDMGKVASLYKIPMKNISDLGDAINWLDDNAQSKGSDIINVLQRMGGVADKLDYRNAAALGSTFLSLGSAAETASTASIAMVRELSIATMQGNRFKGGLKAIGMNAADIEKSMSSDSMGTIIKVLDKIKTLPKETQMRVTTQLFGKEYGKDAAKLSNNMEELHRQIELTHTAASKGSMAREAAIDTDSLSGQWDLLKAAAKNANAAMGETLRAPLMDIIKQLRAAASGTREWIEANPKLAGAILRVMVVISALLLTLGSFALAAAAILGPLALVRLSMSVLGITTLPGLTLGFKNAAGGAGAMLGRLKLLSAQAIDYRGIIAAGTARVKAFTLALLASVKATLAAAAANTKLGFRAVIGGIAGATSALYRKIAAMSAYVVANGVMGTATSLASAGFIKMGAVLKGGLIGSLKAVGQAIAFVGRAALLNPVGLAITAIAVASLLLLKFWQPVKAFFVGLWQGLKEGLGPVGDAFSAAFGAWAGILAPLKPLWDGITWALSGAFGWIGKLLTPLNATSEELAGATSAGKTFGLWLASIISFFPNVIASFTEFGGNLISGMINGISAKAGELKDKVAGMGESVKSWFKDPLGIKSPSKVFTQYGDDTMAGLANGLAKNHDPEQQVTGMAKRLKAAGAGLTLGLAAMPAAAELPDTAPALARIQSQEQARHTQGQSLSQAAPAQAKGITQDFSIGHVEINITAAPGMDAQDIAAQVRREMENYQRQQAARNRGRLGDLE